MPLPTQRDVHVDVALTNISIAYVQAATHFVAGRVFPTVPVSKQSNKYFEYNKSDMRRNQARPRAPGSESAGGGLRLTSNSTYFAEEYAFHKDIPDQVRDNADDPINVDNDATTFVTQQLLIQREVNWASTYFTTGVWGTDVVGATDFTQWDDASSDPEKDIDDAKQAILLATGFMPNVLVVGFPVHLALKRHPLVLDRFKHTTSESITEELLARFFEVDEYMVARASYDTADEGATDSNAFILGKNALLAYRPNAPSLMQPSAGYTFVWTGLTGVNQAGIAVETFRMREKKSDRVEGTFAYDQKAVSTDVGYFFSAAVS